MANDPKFVMLYVEFQAFSLLLLLGNVSFYFKIDLLYKYLTGDGVPKNSSGACFIL